MKKLSKKGLQRKADALWSLKIRTRDPICRLCKSRPTKHAHHIIDRRHKAVRLLLANGLGLDSGCHFYIEGLFKADRYDPFKHRELYWDCITNIIGVEEYEELLRLSKIRVKYNERFIEEAIKKLEGKDGQD